MIVRRFWRDADDVFRTEMIEWRITDEQWTGPSIVIEPPSDAEVEYEFSGEASAPVHWVSVAAPAFDGDAVHGENLYDRPLGDGAVILTREAWEQGLAAARQAAEEQWAASAAERAAKGQAKLDALRALGENAGLTQDQIAALVGEG